MKFSGFCRGHCSRGRIEREEDVVRGASSRRGRCRCSRKVEGGRELV